MLPIKYATVTTEKFYSIDIYTVVLAVKEGEEVGRRKVAVVVKKLGENTGI